MHKCQRLINKCITCTQRNNYQKYMIVFFPEKNTTVKVMIRSANQFYVTANQVGNCVAVTANQFFWPSLNTAHNLRRDVCRSRDVTETLE